MKIFIAVPTYENICPDTYKSIYGLDPAGNWLVFDFIRGYDCATARNRIAEQAVSEQADYVLMVDNDIVLPSDALVHLLEDPQDVCLGIYANREADNLYNGNMCIYKPGEYDYVTKYTAAEIRALREFGRDRILVHGGGMGCALIRTSLFQRLQKPAFDWVNYENGTMLSEDLYFCEQCSNAGVPVYADTRVTCGHVFRHIQWPV